MIITQKQNRRLFQVYLGEKNHTKIKSFAKNLAIHKKALRTTDNTSEHRMYRKSGITMQL